MFRLKHHWKWITSKRYRRYYWLKEHLQSYRIALHFSEAVIRISSPRQLIETFLHGLFRSKRLNRVIINRLKEIVEEKHGSKPEC